MPVNEKKTQSMYNFHTALFTLKMPYGCVCMSKDDLTSLSILGELQKTDHHQFTLSFFGVTVYQDLTGVHEFFGIKVYRVIYVVLGK